MRSYKPIKSLYFNRDIFNLKLLLSASSSSPHVADPHLSILFGEGYAT